MFSSSLRNVFVPLASGVLFGFGLLISGMTDPATVLGFLDLGGHWNPQLAFVMGGAVLVTLPAFTVARRRGRTLEGAPLSLPRRFGLDRRLIAGSALFGLGWGLSGVCPGPALLLIVGGQPAAWVFFGGLLAGMISYTWIDRRRTGSGAPAAVSA